MWIMTKKRVTKKKETKIEDLARMVQVGFGATGKEIQGLREDIDGLREDINEEFRLVKGRLDAIEMELLDIKKKLNNVVYRHEFEFLKDRIEKLEKKVASVR